MRFREVFVVVLLASVVSACGGSGAESESGSDGDQGPADAVGDEATSPDTAAPEASRLCPDATNAAPERLPVGEILELPDEGAEHVVCADFHWAPPAGGAHFPVWQNCGVYNQPIQNQTAVHSLEHGAVWVAYQPNLDRSSIEMMTERLKSEQFALAAPYPGLQNPFVLTAWRRQLAVDDWTDPAVTDFLDTYMGRYSPVAPEAGASCGQAVGSAPDKPNLNYQEILEQVN